MAENPQIPATAEEIQRLQNLAEQLGKTLSTLEISKLRSDGTKVREMIGEWSVELEVFRRALAFSENEVDDVRDAFVEVQKEIRKSSKEAKLSGIETSTLTSIATKLNSVYNTIVLSQEEISSISQRDITSAKEKLRLASIQAEAAYNASIIRQKDLDFAKKEFEVKEKAQGILSEADNQAYENVKKQIRAETILRGELSTQMIEKYSRTAGIQAKAQQESLKAVEEELTLIKSQLVAQKEAAELRAKDTTSASSQLQEQQKLYRSIQKEVSSIEDSLSYINKASAETDERLRGELAKYNELLEAQEKLISSKQAEAKTDQTSLQNLQKEQQFYEDIKKEITGIETSLKSNIKVNDSQKKKLYEELEAYEQKLEFQKELINSKKDEAEAEQINLQNLQSEIDKQEASLKIIQKIRENKEKKTGEDDKTLAEIYLENLEKQEKKANNIKKSLGIIPSALQGVEGLLNKVGMGALAASLNIDEINSKVAAYTEMVTDSGEKQLKGLAKAKVLWISMKEIASSIAKSVVDPAVMFAGGIGILSSLAGGLISILKKAVDLALQFDTLTFETAKNLGIQSDEAKTLLDTFNKMAIANRDSYISTKEMAATYGQMVEAFGYLVPQSKEFAETAYLIQRRTGASAEELKGLYEISALNNTTLDKTYQTLVASAKIEGARNKIAITNRQAMQAMSKLSATTLLNFKGNITALMAGVVQAQKMGTTLENINKQAQGFLNFEQSINDQFELELLTGKQINAEKLRSAVMNRDAKTTQEEMLRLFDQLGEVGEDNMIIYESTAKFMNMSTDELSEQIKNARTIRSLGLEQGTTLKDGIASLAKTLQGQQKIRDVLGEQALTDAKRATVMEKLSNSWDQIVLSVGSQLQPVLQDISTILAGWIQSLNDSGGFTQVVEKIKKFFLDIKDYAGTIEAKLIKWTGSTSGFSGVLDVIIEKLQEGAKLAAAIGGAMTGASIGGVAGPWGAAIGAIVGGVSGYSAAESVVGPTYTTKAQGGIVEGKSHSEGGNKYVSMDKNDPKIQEIEAGEFIVRKEQVVKHRELLETINKGISPVSALKKEPTPSVPTIVQPPAIQKAEPKPVQQEQKVLSPRPVEKATPIPRPVAQEAEPLKERERPLEQKALPTPTFKPNVEVSLTPNFNITPPPVNVNQPAITQAAPTEVPRPEIVKSISTEVIKENRLFNTRQEEKQEKPEIRQVERPEIKQPEIASSTIKVVSESRLEDKIQGILEKILNSSEKTNMILEKTASRPARAIVDASSFGPLSAGVAREAVRNPSANQLGSKPYDG